MLAHRFDRPDRVGAITLGDEVPKRAGIESADRSG